MYLIMKSFFVHVDQGPRLDNNNIQDRVLVCAALYKLCKMCIT